MRNLGRYCFSPLKCIFACFSYNITLIIPPSNINDRTDMKLHLAGTDYGDFLQNEPSPLHTTTIAEKCTQKLVEEFEYLRANSYEPLTTFLNYLT